MSNDSFYHGRKWRVTRAEHLADHPFCAVCAMLRIRTTATEVDHVKRKELVADPYDHANLRSLCKSHHSQKTVSTEGFHKGKKPFQVTGPDGWPIPYSED